MYVLRDTTRVVEWVESVPPQKNRIEMSRVYNTKNAIETLPCVKLTESRHFCVRNSYWCQHRQIGCSVIPPFFSLLFVDYSCKIIEMCTSTKIHGSSWSTRPLDVGQPVCCLFSLFFQFILDVFAPYFLYYLAIYDTRRSKQPQSIANTA